MQQEDTLGYALELVQARLGDAPKGFDAGGARSALDAFLLVVADAPVNADICQPVVAPPAVGVNYGCGVNFALSNGRQGFLRAVWDCRPVGRAVSKAVKPRENRRSTWRKLSFEIFA